MNSVSLYMQNFFLVGSFLSSHEKNHWQWCCNNQSATSLVFLLSLRSTLQPSWRTSPQQGSRQPVKTKNNRGILRLGLSCALFIARIYIFERGQDHQKRECGIIMQNLVYLNIPQCYQMSLAQDSFLDSDRRVRLSTNSKTISPFVLVLVWVL